MGGRTDALRESVVLIKQRCRCVYELFIHAAALLFFGFFAVNFVKVKSFAPRQIQRRSFAALAITLSRKIF